MSEPLADKMRRLPDREVTLKDGSKSTLHALAGELDAAPTSDPRRLLRAWARARWVYCQITGERLI